MEFGFSVDSLTAMVFHVSVPQFYEISAVEKEDLRQLVDLEDQRGRISLEISYVSSMLR